MAVTFMTGFEGQESTLDNVVFTGAPTYNTTTKRTGAASLRCNPAAAANIYATLPTSPAPKYMHFAFYIASMPTSYRMFAGNTLGAALVLYSDGTVDVTNNGAVQQSLGVTLQTGIWYWIGLKIVTSASSMPVVQINGVTYASFANATGTAVIGTLDSGSACDFYYDDVIVDDTDFLQPSAVGLLVPVTDFSRATLWTGGVGGTTSLWNAVDNRPPIGTATETDLTQIEHAGGAAGTTDAYEARTDSITSLYGVSASDTLLAAQIVAVHGEDISTGAKLLAFSAPSNPTITSSGNVTCGDSTPSALGTYPTEWGVHFGTMAAPPGTWTISSASQLKVVRPETASRVASVCFMGLLCAWTWGWKAGEFQRPITVPSRAVARAASW